MGALTKEATKPSPQGVISPRTSPSAGRWFAESPRILMRLPCACIPLHLVEEHFFYLCFAEKGGDTSPTS